MNSGFKFLETILESRGRVFTCNSGKRHAHGYGEAEEKLKRAPVESEALGQAR